MALGPEVDAGGCLSWQRLKSERAVTQASSSGQSLSSCYLLCTAQGASLCSKHPQLSNWDLLSVGVEATLQKQKKCLGDQIGIEGYDLLI